MASTLAAPHEYTETVKKSVFMARASAAADVRAAMGLVAQYSDAGATHNCWAYRVGTAYRFSDDGEPGGTAGRPILQAIEGQDCDQVVVVVTRWYGGINLGTGGLARAYGGTAANCLRLAQRVQIIDTVSASCVCGFADLQWLKSRLAQAGATITAESFGADGVALTLSVPRAVLDDLRQAVSNASRGQSTLRVSDADRQR
jgi:putative IMPACT (imprinted ancient) family translation regulator